MGDRSNEESARSRPPAAEELSSLLRGASQDKIGELLDRGDLNESQVSFLLMRRDLRGELLDRIARRPDWLKSRRIRCELVAHPRTPRRVAIRLARELYVMDLVDIALRTSVPPEVRRLAGEILLTRIPHLPLGEKVVLARRGPARAVGALLAEGHERVVRAALDNGLLTEAQILRALADAALPVMTVTLIARHAKWPLLSAVRNALICHPNASLAEVTVLLPSLPRRDLVTLSTHPRLRPDLRDALMRELAERSE